MAKCIKFILFQHISAYSTVLIVSIDLCGPVLNDEHLGLICLMTILFDEINNIFTK